LAGALDCASDLFKKALGAATASVPNGTDGVHRASRLVIIKLIRRQLHNFCMPSMAKMFSPPLLGRCCRRRRLWVLCSLCARRAAAFFRFYYCSGKEN